MTQGASIVWFRRDLRLSDNAALRAAVQRGRPIVPIFIWSPEEEGAWQPGAASRWWLHQSLKALSRALEIRGAELVLRRGPSYEALHAVINASGADAVYWNRLYEPAIVERDSIVEKKLRANGCRVEISDGALLLEPGAVRTKAGRPFQVFTAYWRSCLQVLDPGRPIAAPRKLIPVASSPQSIPIDAFKLEPRVKWTSGLANAWQPGEAGAWRLLRHFCAKDFAHYRLNRDRPDLSATSRLSPHLHFGEITPNQIWHEARQHQVGDKMDARWKNSRFITEIGWREFAHHLLWHFPHTPEQPLREEFERFPWLKNHARLKAWQQGRTGYPLVDAGMRELWATGWMHNRVRMMTASFLVKHLLVPWQDGAHWFWDTLVDADLANNTLGWQWTAGCGADAAPFFRIFNPVIQGEKFDPNGDYVKKWVPELAKMPGPWIHKPWKAPASVLQEAGVVLGRSYPGPIVDHVSARFEAMAAFARMRR